MYIYTNISDTEQDLIGFGVVKAGESITVNKAIENPNFQFISEAEDEAKITGIVTQSENAVTQAEKIDTTEGVN